MASYERSYGTARPLFGIIEIVCWLMVGVGILSASGSLSNLEEMSRYGEELIALFGIGSGIALALGGLIGVGVVQSSRANGEQAEMTRDQLQIARLTFEKTFGTTTGKGSVSSSADECLKGRPVSVIPSGGGIRRSGLDLEKGSLDAVVR
jgi:hypothetical protein